MGVFDDKKFEQLDWMTQVTETIDSELNGLLARLPDEKKFNLEDLLPLLDDSYSLSLSSGNLVRQMLTEIENNLEYEEINRIAQCFKFEFSGPLEINYETLEMTGELKLVKVVKTIEDEDLQKMMGGKGLDSFKSNGYNETMCPRANEILEVIDAPKETRRTRSIRKKMRAIRERLKIVFTNNEWRIRDMDLANKISLWSIDYIRTGNLSGMVNLCKLKAMTTYNMPIYSIEEEK